MSIIYLSVHPSIRLYDMNTEEELRWGTKGSEDSEGMEEGGKRHVNRRG